MTEKPALQDRVAMYGNRNVSTVSLLAMDVMTAMDSQHNTSARTVARTEPSLSSVFASARPETLLTG
jgi:hypothetical protein